jgi:hypothetical protein
VYTISTQIALADTQKGNLSVTKYVGRIMMLANEMATVGKN